MYAMIDRGFLTPLFHGNTPILPTPTPFSNFVQRYPFPVASNLHPTAAFVVLFFWLNGRSQYIWSIILLNDIMDLHMPSLGTFVPEGPCCVFFCNKT